MIDNVYSFMYVKPDLYLCNKVSLVVMNDLVDMILHLICWDFTENICIYVHQGGVGLGSEVLGRLRSDILDK